MGTDQLTQAFVQQFTDGKEQLNPTELLNRLVADGLLQEQQMRHYLILKEYPQVLADNDGHITSTVYQLAHRFNISDRQVQNVLYKYRRRYRVG